jgi:hypothetical protein
VSTCARCGADLSMFLDSAAGQVGEPLECPDGESCSRRELANLRSLLRSVTSKLESAASHLSEGHTTLAARAIDSVLETLS